MADRYAFSQYLVDPCKWTWSKVIRVVALVLRFVRNIMLRVALSSTQALQDGGHRHSADAEAVYPGDNAALRERAAAAASVLPQEREAAERYFFKKTTEEVLQFSKLKDYKDCSETRDGIMLFTGRILDSRDVHAL